MPRTATPPRKRTPYPAVPSVDAFVPTADRPLRLRSRDVPADAHLEPHAHPWGQLAFCATGVIQLLMEGDKPMACIAPPSRLVWVPPGMPHAVTVLEAARTHTLYLHAGAAPHMPDAPRVLAVSPLLRELILALDRAPEPAREAQIAQLILSELQIAEALPLGVPLPRAEGGDKRLRALCEAVIESPAERATLADWARTVGASERTAARLFRDELGTSYQHWRQQAVLAHALPLLARGAPVGEVAAACGYESQSAFSAMVKAALGQSPSALRA